MSGNMAAARWQEEMARESGQIVVGVPQIIELLQEFLEQISSLKNEQQLEESSAFIEWNSNVESLLRRTFGEKSVERTSFHSINYYPMSGFGDEDFSELKRYYERGLDSASAQLKSATKMLSTMGVPKQEPVVRKSGTNVTVNPTFNQDNHMSQRQEQTQTMTLEQTLDRLQNIVDTQLDEEEIEQIREVLEKFKQNPGVWSYAKQLIVAGSGFSRDVAVQFIGSVLAAAALGAK